ncbi:MAG: DUF5716 family protein [Lachnospiraceae bacterium]
MLFRDKKNLLFAGIELGNKISQISFCSSDHPEPETVSVVAGKEQYGIPTVLCKRFDVNQWFFGKDAIKHGDGVEGVLIEDLVERAVNQEILELDGEKFEAVSLLALFVKRSLSLLNLAVGTDRPDYLMITVDRLDSRMVEVLNEVGKYLQMDREHVFFQSHVDSFYQYCMHQPEELRVHEVLVCDYREDGLRTLRMECNRRTNPIVAFVEEHEFAQLKAEPLPEEEPYRTRQAQNRDQLFEGILEKLLEGHIVTCVYLLGDGFTSDWCRESLRYMCRNRRVFQGSNLYSKGACYAVYEKILPGEISKKYIFLGKDKVKANVDIMAVSDGREQQYPLLDAGTNWYDVDKEWDFVLESGNELVFVITPLTGKDKKQMKMVLEGLPERPANASRIHLHMQFQDEEHMSLEVTDLGFGEFFAPSGFRQEEIVAL